MHLIIRISVACNLLSSIALLAHHSDTYNTVWQAWSSCRFSLINWLKKKMFFSFSFIPNSVIYQTIWKILSKRYTFRLIPYQNRFSSFQVFNSKYLSGLFERVKVVSQCRVSNSWNLKSVFVLFLNVGRLFPICWSSRFESWYITKIRHSIIRTLVAHHLCPSLASLLSLVHYQATPSADRSYANEHGVAKHHPLVTK